jgi:hypothetical protein
LSPDELQDALDLVRLREFDLTNVQVVHYDDVAGSLGTTGPVWVHPESRCKSTDREILGCCIHAPSKHPLNTAPLAWVAEAHCMIRVCEHGEGHTDPDDLAYRTWSVMNTGGPVHTVSALDAKEMAVERYQFTHACTCKCCVPPAIEVPA